MEQIIDILKNDHDYLREILNALETVLQQEGKTGKACEVVLARLEEGLEDHLKKEEYLLSFLYSLTKKPLKGYHEEREHLDIRTTIRLLRDLLREGSDSVSVGVIQTYGSHLIDTLRDHMAEEEAVVFPIAARALGEETLETIADLVVVREGGGGDERTHDFEKRPCAHPLDPRTVGKRDLGGV